MGNKRDYIEALKEAIWNMHGCRAAYLKTDHICETFQGQGVWAGDVEVFRLKEHPKAQHAYAWAHLEGANDDKTRFVIVLEIPPVKDAKSAVKQGLAGS